MSARVVRTTVERYMDGNHYVDHDFSDWPPGPVVIVDAGVWERAVRLLRGCPLGASTVSGSTVRAWEERRDALLAEMDGEK